MTTTSLRRRKPTIPVINLSCQSNQRKSRNGSKRLNPSNSTSESLNLAPISNRTKRDRMLETFHSPTQLPGLESCGKTLQELVQSTLQAHESNSIVLIGAAGSGKSALVNKALASTASDVRIVSLDGDVHHDERLAARSLAHQLKLAEAYNQKGFVSKLWVFLGLIFSCSSMNSFYH